MISDDILQYSNDNKKEFRYVMTNIQYTVRKPIITNIHLL